MCNPKPAAAAALAVACLLAAGWTEMQRVTPSEATPTVDGKVFEGEYDAWARGINKSFGDRIGQRSRLYLRTDTRYLYIGIRSVNGFPDNEVDGVVMYLDTAEGGYASTSEFSDYSTVPRALASGVGTKAGHRAVLNFPPSFKPEYALFVRYRDAGVLRLSSDYHDLAAAGQAQSTTGNVHYVHSNGTNLEIRVWLEDIGLGPAAPVKFIWTLLNGEDAYRSDEFIGVNAYPGGSIGQKSATLSDGDGMLYVPAAAEGF